MARLLRTTNRSRGQTLAEAQAGQAGGVDLRGSRASHLITGANSKGCVPFEFEAAQGFDTGADTHYSEVRAITLPSGLSSFSTLQAIMPDAPRNIGPYVPHDEFDGDIADTAALEKWIASLAAKTM
jgi:hypothetical protein